MTRKVAIVGAYGSGKTSFSVALSQRSGLPRTHGSPMREPVGGAGRGVQAWSPADVLQLTVRRFTERLIDEARHPGGFLSDGSSVHEWAYTKLRLVAGSFPADRTPLAALPRAAGTAPYEEVTDALGLLMREHATRTYDLFFHLPVEFPLSEADAPVNENFRHLFDDILLPVLRDTGIPLHHISGTLAERLEQAEAILGTSTERRAGEIPRAANGRPQRPGAPSRDSTATTERTTR